MPYPHPVCGSLFKSAISRSITGSAGRGSTGQPYAETLSIGTARADRVVVAVWVALGVTVTNITVDGSVEPATAQSSLVANGPVGMRAFLIPSGSVARFVVSSTGSASYQAYIYAAYGLQDVNPISTDNDSDGTIAVTAADQGLVIGAVRSGTGTWGGLTQDDSTTNSAVASRIGAFASPLNISYTVATSICAMSWQ